MVSYFQPINQDLFNLGDLSTFQARDVTEAITDFGVSLSLQGSSQISVSLVDPGFTFAKANYFQVRRDIFYRNLWFEISAVSTQRSQAIYPEYQIECRSKAVQLMKRDKRPEAYRGMSAYEFAFTIAKRFQMNFVGEQTTKKPAVVKGKTRNSDDSVWTVLTGLAQEQQFVCFESENTLFFCSEKFLLGKWGDPKYAFGDFKWIPFFYPDTTDPVWADAQRKYILLEQPSLRRSDDDINAAEGSMLVDRANGVNLRPGMTIFLGGIPDFEAFYLVTDVSFNEGSNDPVQVQFRLPVDPDKEKLSTSTAQGSSPTGGSRGANPIDPAPGLGLNQVPRDQTLSAQGSRSYTRDALSRMGYKGPNSNKIINIVDASVEFYNAGALVSSIYRAIREDASISAQERDLVIKIFTSYVANKPASTLGVAGGISGSAIQQTADQLERQQAQNAQPPSPLFQPTTGPVLRASSLSSSSRQAITRFVKANLRQSTGEQDVISSAVSSAQNILNLRTNAQKQNEFRRLKVGAQSANARSARVRYNAIIQASVLNEIAPGWNVKNFGVNSIQVPEGFTL